MSLQDALTENRRLYLLKTLKQAGDYRMSDRYLQETLNAIAIGASLAIIRGDCAWLEQQGLIATSTVGTMTIALLRPAGLDVANGVATVPGIARPQPE
jgi:hypothetical protein